LATISLDRRFFEWRNTDDELSDPDILSRFGLSDSAKSWDDLLKRRRVVILAEAGSGKTEELKEQARRLSADNKLAFYATVQDVGRDGLERAIGDANRAKLTVWRASDRLAWFFVDSIDEAKLDGIRLERALCNIADGIEGAEGRAYIVLSGRHTDWEFRRDLAHLHEQLPIPPDQEAPAAPTPDELLIRTLRHERPEERAKDPDGPLVVVLASLDAGRVRLFAAGKNAPNLDALLAEIESLNLWRFARRPLDLDWLVQFWKTNNRLGSLCEMLATSLKERLQEPDPARARRDPIDADRAMEALERVGAALVFGRHTTIAIPDTEIVLSSDHSPLDLVDVLPDWGGDNRLRLLNRPVFDPATFGRVRLHNDNEGVVRAYLAARWLHRLRKTNLSRQGLFSLLFADTYGLQLVKPSVAETSAWLSLWDIDVAREVIHREPYILLTGGDPASLPTDARVSVLTRLIERMVANDEHLPLLDYDSVKRFSRPDIAPTVRQLWSVHRDHHEARDLLLRLTWLGGLRECADLAAAAAFGGVGSSHDRIAAGRAFMATADEAQKSRYAAHVVAECAALPPTVVWDAVEALFPSIMDVDDLLTILGRVDVTDRAGGVGFQWQSPDLIKRIDSPADLERLLVGLTALMGEEPEHVRPELDDREEGFLTAIAAAAHRLVTRSPANDAPPLAVDAAVRIGRHLRFGHQSIWERAGDAGGELRKTSARRRIAFWRAAERLQGHRLLQGRPIQNTWDLEMLGWSPGLSMEDLDWLLVDAPTRTLAHERRLGINAALLIWAQADRPDGVSERIRLVAYSDAVMTETFDAWMRPQPSDPALAESERELRRLREQNAVARAQSDQSWLDFINGLRGHPDQLRHINPATAEGIDSRLYHLWRLLSSAARSNARYAIDSVAPVEPILGQELAAALRDGLIRHWRTWQPTTKRERQPNNRIQMSTLDCMGIAGAALEAHQGPDWVNHLDVDLARRATVYATLEINGFPKWMADLSSRWPQQVTSILLREIVAELDGPDGRHGVLGDLGRAHANTVALMVPPLLDELDRRPNLPALVLSPLLDVLERAATAPERARLAALAVDRFDGAQDVDVGSLYIGAAFTVDHALATEALVRKIDGLQPADQVRLVQQVLPHVFGDRITRARVTPPLSFRSHEQLVRLAFQTIRVEDDIDHPSGVVYSPDPRDDAQRARSAVFNQFTGIPGRATFNALLAFAGIPGFPVTPRRLRELARDRAAQDSESAPWPSGEACAFEEKCESLPQTTHDLQRLILARLSDFQYELLHDDFPQGSTLCGLPNEKAVQIWMGDRLRGMQGRSYSVERESKVVDEKEPDIRVRSAPDASVPIEIKVPESWSREQLEGALADQLCGRYLRARNARHGILLLVHQKARSRGWTRPQDGGHMTFGEIVEHLRAMAREIAGTHPDGPQPEIAVIDVSSCFVVKKDADRKKKSGKARGHRRPAPSSRKQKIKRGVVPGR
jgi:hypothetical protein